MPLKVLFQVLLDGFIGDFNLSIALGVIGGGEHFLYPKLFTKRDELQVVKLFSVVRDHGMGEAEAAYDVLLQKVCIFCLDLLGQGLHFDPLRKVVYCHEAIPKL